MHSIDTALLLKKRKLKKYLKKNKKRMKELRKALRFYADWYNWVTIPENGGSSTYTDWDRGTIARKALRLPPPGDQAHVAPTHESTRDKSEKVRNGLAKMTKHHEDLTKRLDEED